MNMLSLIPIALLLLVGGAALFFGRRGINVQTLVAAWLVLIFSVVFIVIAGLVANWEGAWRAEIRRLQDEIAKTTDGTGAADSLTDLDASATSLRRELAEVETWRNRYWVTDKFTPPEIAPADDGTELFEATKAGTVTLELGGGDEPPLNVGAELAIFFPAGGTDAFRQLARELQATLSPKAFLGIFSVEAIAPGNGTSSLVTVAPLTTPDQIDKVAWEAWDKAGSLADPADLLVFEDLPTDRWPAEASGSEPDDGEDGPVSLEEATAALASGESLPGEYWATVTINNDAAIENLKEGQALELDLLTAQRLAETGAVSIDNVVRRRRLIDPLTALRGTRFSTAQPDGVPAAGIEGIRRTLGLELASLSLMQDRIGGAREATERETERKQKLAMSLAKDRDAWMEDIDFAGRAIERLVQRRDKTAADLAAARKAITAYREELAALTAEIFAKTARRRGPATDERPAARSAAIP